MAFSEYPNFKIQLIILKKQICDIPMGLFIFKFKIISTDTFKNPKKDVFVKLGYSEKATEFEKNFHLKFDATQ